MHVPHAAPVDVPITRSPMAIVGRRNGSAGGRNKPLIEDPLVELPASMRAALSSGGDLNTEEEVLSNSMAHTRAMPSVPSSSSLSVGLSRAPPRVSFIPALGSMTRQLLCLVPNSAYAVTFIKFTVVLARAVIRVARVRAQTLVSARL